jgi:Holliday junction resolvasome RuvABC endonuclease subunit
MKRLFIDPATHSTGWALFNDAQLVLSGTISVEGKDVWRRLSMLQVKYKNLLEQLGPVEEVHIEKFWRAKMKESLQWAVAAIGLGCVGRAVSIAQDVVVTSWQPKMKYKKGNVPRKYKKLAASVGSEDELEAILMGYYWLEHKVGK